MGPGCMGCRLERCLGGWRRNGPSKCATPLPPFLFLADTYYPAAPWYYNATAWPTQLVNVQQFNREPLADTADLLNGSRHTFHSACKLAKGCTGAPNLCCACCAGMPLLVACCRCIPQLHAYVLRRRRSMQCGCEVAAGHTCWQRRHWSPVADCQHKELQLSKQVVTSKAGQAAWLSTATSGCSWRSNCEQFRRLG